MEKGDRVLVTGATGFTGTCLVKKLVAQGLQVRAIARPSSNISAFDGMDIEWIRADVFDREALKQASQGLQYVFHVAACFREAGVPDDYYRKVHVESTQHLAEFASANPDFKRFVHVSTMGVHGHIENPPANEESPFAPGDLYQVTKLEAEQWLHNFAAEKKLPYTVIRPMAIFGPGDKRLLKVFKMASKPVFPVLGFGKCLYHLIHVEDLSDAMIHAADEPRALGEAFLCGNTEAIGLIDMGKIIASELGSRFIVLRLPVTPFFWLGDLCEMVCKPFGVEPPIYRRRVAFFTKDRSFDTSKLRDVLGYTPKYDNERGLRETTRWYIEHGWLKGKKAGHDSLRAPVTKA